MEYKPVCDNTGQTHSNKCAFENVACKDLLQRFIVREGACDVSVSECEQICTMEYKPVCDNTGRTHSNKCAFENVACKDLLQRFIVREGACDDGGSSDDVLDDVAVDAVAGNLERYPIGPYPNVNRPIVNQRPSAVCRARYSYHPSK